MKYIQDRQKLLKTAVFIGSFLVAGAVSAAVPTAATDALTTITSDFNTLVDSFWGVLATVLGAFVVIKIVKKLVGQI